MTKWFRTLRVRLTLWSTIIVLMAVVGALLSVREGVRFYLLLESDVVLNDEAKELLLAIERWYPDHEQIIAEMEQKATGHADRGWYIRWLAPDRAETVWATQNAPPTAKFESILSAQQHRVWSSQGFRAVERRLNEPNMPAYYVRVGMPTRFVDDDVDRLTRVAAPIAVAIFLLAPLGGFFISDRAIHPLRDLIQTTERLRPSRLEERLRIRGVDDELDQLASKINQFLDQIADHLRQQRDFVANAAHELRSPLAAVLSSIEVAVEKRRSPEDYEEVLFSVSEQCRHLTQLVNQLLQLAESGSDTPQPPHVPQRLDGVAQWAADMFSPVAEERGVTLTCECDADTWVLGYSPQLRQLVINLVDNAIKFTPAGGGVRLEVRKDLPRQKAIMTVADTGIGIPPEDVQKIFERFYRVDRARSRNSDVRGNGLGLSICEAIARNHGGTITVTSELGVGTTLTTTMPLSVGSSNPDPERPASPY